MMNWAQYHIGSMITRKIFYGIDPEDDGVYFDRK